MEKTVKTDTQSAFINDNEFSIKQSTQADLPRDGFIDLQLNIRCEHYRRLQAAAAAQGVSIGELIERMIDTWRAIARERN